MTRRPVTAWVTRHIFAVWPGDLTHAPVKRTLKFYTGAWLCRADEAQQDRNSSPWPCACVRYWSYRGVVLCDLCSFKLSFLNKHMYNRISGRRSVNFLVNKQITVSSFSVRKRNSSATVLLPPASYQGASWDFWQQVAGRITGKLRKRKGTREGSSIGDGVFSLLKIPCACRRNPKERPGLRRLFRHEYPEIIGPTRSLSYTVMFKELK